MLLAALAATTLLELRTADLGSVLGWYPPAWGSTPSEVMTDYPRLVMHTGHVDADAGPPSPEHLHIRDPLLWISGSRPRFVHFAFAPWGLEAVAVEHRDRARPAFFVLGAPSCVRQGVALWRRRNVVIAFVGEGLMLFLARPGSRPAEIFEELSCPRSSTTRGRSRGRSRERPRPLSAHRGSHPGQRAPPSGLPTGGAIGATTPTVLPSCCRA